MSADESFSVVAVVSMNGAEGLVLNRPLRFLYERANKDYIGSDGPFRDVLRYQWGSGRNVAFAGREFPITLTDGTVVRLKDHWWHSVFPGTASVAVGDVESLTKCYVFGGGICILPADLAALRATYAGPVHDYWEYKKTLQPARSTPPTECGEGSTP